MKRRHLLLIAAILWTAACAKDSGPRRPNFLFLFTDDQRADTVGALGNLVIKTPNLDAIARSGFVFRNAYCLGGNVPAVCSPSRNMLLSGRAYFRWEGRLAPPEPANLPDAMKQLGYFTYHHGKRGNTAADIHPRFDITKYVNDLEARTSGEPGQQIVDEAIEFLNTRDPSQPFFMYLAFAAPHDPRVAAQHYRDQYRPEEIPLPRNYLPVHPFDNGEQLVRDELLAPWPRTEDEIRRHLHDYYAMITGLDHHIGRLISHLKETGQFDNTIVIFSSDQGLAVGSHGLMGKQNLYDHSMKAPLFLAGPGIPQGGTDALIYLLDLFPTIVELAGGEPPSGIDGMSVAPIIRGISERGRRSLFLAYREVQRAIRDDRYKLIVYPHNNMRQLFDLESDPGEMNNLAPNPEYADRIAAMMTAMRAWQDQLGDKLPLENPSPQKPDFTPPTGEALSKIKAQWKMK